MALSPGPAVAFGLLWTLWVNYMTGAQAAASNIPDCTGWDIMAGCDGTTTGILSTIALGTIPGGNPDFNAFLIVIGLIGRVVAGWGIMELIRGA